MIRINNQFHRAKMTIEKAYTTLLKKASTSTLISLCLFPLALLSYVFFIGVVIRRWFLQRRCRGRTMKARVISIGNVTVGGTGKTPLIALLLNTLPGTVGVASRGYRRQKTGLYVFSGDECDLARSGDEAALLGRRFPRALFAVCEDKWQAVQALDSRCETILLDDGLQRYDIPTDLSIATIDCGCPDGYGWLLPRGLLREPFSWLGRADYFVITNADESLPRLLTSLAPFARPTMVTVPKITRFFSADGETCTIPSGCPVALISGIARPERFRRSMESLGYRVLDHYELPDHGEIHREEVQSWMARLRSQCNDVVFVATEKDWTRHQWSVKDGILFSSMNLEIISGQDVFDRIMHF
jgi:tetraacyldisaccharide 4'-kinase